MKHWRFYALAFFLAASSSWGEALEPGDFARLEKSRYIQRVLQESYLDNEGGVASVFGYNLDEFILRNTYLNLTIYGAVTGHRGGYGIAAFGVGQRVPLNDQIDLDFKAIAGSGGGGGFKAGGGLAFEGLGGLSWRFTKGFFADVRAGYLIFPTGTFRSTVVSVGLAFEFWRLELPTVL